MDKFLEKYNLPKLNQEEIENLNRDPSQAQKSKLQSKIFQQTKAQEDVLRGEFYQKLREELTPIHQGFPGGSECDQPWRMFRVHLKKKGE